MKSTASVCVCGQDAEEHYRGRGVCRRTSCPCQMFRGALPKTARQLRVVERVAVVAPRQPA